jgi:hypothetical protein
MNSDVSSCVLCVLWALESGERLHLSGVFEGPGIITTPAEAEDVLLVSLLEGGPHAVLRWRQRYHFPLVDLLPPISMRVPECQHLCTQVLLVQMQPVQLH